MKQQQILVKDLNGFDIEVEDLEGAIAQADYCRSLSQEIPQDFGRYRQRYWEDLYGKLQKLKIEDHG